MFAWRRQAPPLLYTHGGIACIVVAALASAMLTSPCLRHAHLTLPPPSSPHLASAMLTSPCLRHAHLTLPPPCSPHLASAMLTSPCHHCLLLYLLLCFLERSRPRRSARVGLIWVSGRRIMGAPCPR